MRGCTVEENWADSELSWELPTLGAAHLRTALAYQQEKIPIYWESGDHGNALVLEFQAQNSAEPNRVC